MLISSILLCRLLQRNVKYNREKYKCFTMRSNKSQIFVNWRLVCSKEMAVCNSKCLVMYSVSNIYIWMSEEGLNIVYFTHYIYYISTTSTIYLILFYLSSIFIFSSPFFLCQAFYNSWFEVLHMVSSVLVPLLLFFRFARYPKNHICANIV